MWQHRAVIVLCIVVAFSSVLIGPKATPVFASPAGESAAPQAIVPPASTLTVIPSEGGSVALTPVGPSYVHGTAVTAQALPEPGWVFSHWEGDIGTASSWWDTRWGYRFPLTLLANGFAREDVVADVSVNFGAMLSGLGVVAPFNPNSIRVVEVDGSGALVNANVLFQYHPWTVGGPSGRLSLLVDGATAAGAARLYHVYFDTNVTIPAPLLLAPRVVITPGVVHAGAAAFQIDTDIGTYFMEPNNGGISSMIDLADNDWISFDPTPGSQDAGEYRGIPNAVFPGGYFHPGFDVASSTFITQTGDVYNARFREMFYIASTDGKWEAEWTFYPRYATFNVLKKAPDKNFWLLYEGTPGGELEPDIDIVGRSDGTQALASEEWNADIVGEEWVYFVDPSVGQSLFLVHHQEDDIVDTYYPFGTMTVLGFGRMNPSIDGQLTTLPQTLTIGFANGQSHNTIETAVHNAYKGMGVNVGAVERPVDLPVTVDASQISLGLTMNFDRVIQAVFERAEYQLQIDIVGDGEVEINPEKASYEYGDEVTLSATPTITSKFVRWSGASSSVVPEITLTITATTAITAHFDLQTYGLTINVDGPGSVTRDPVKAIYEHGDTVTLEAVPDSAATFIGWSGGVTGTELIQSVTITDPVVVTATFASLYTLTVGVEGEGIVNPAGGVYVAGDETQLSAIAAAGWVFTGWSGDAVGQDNPLEVVMDRAKSIIGTFKRVRTVNVQVDGNGVVNVAPEGPYYEGQKVTLTAVPATGGENWIFTGWNGDITSTDNPLELNLTGNVNLTGRFVRGWQLTVETQGDGDVEITPESQLYVDGTGVTLVATPASGWRFSHWGDDLSGERETAELAIRRDVNVAALFVPESAPWDVHLPLVRMREE